MTAQQQEPTMREEIARWAGDPGEPLTEEQWQELSGGYRAFLLSRADLLMAVLERRGDDDAARVRRVRELAVEFERLPGDMSVFAADVARWIRRALDGDDTGSRQ